LNLYRCFKALNAVRSAAVSADCRHGGAVQGLEFRV
jgi:hypothetical protein